MIQRMLIIRLIHLIHQHSSDVTRYVLLFGDTSPEQQIPLSYFSAANAQAALHRESPPVANGSQLRNATEEFHLTARDAAPKPISQQFSVRKRGPVKQACLILFVWGADYTEGKAASTCLLLEPVCFQNQIPGRTP